jgi:hypothetical protein
MAWPYRPTRQGVYLNKETRYSIRRETVWCDDTGRAITRFVLRDPMLNNVGMARTLRDLRVNHHEARG